jgi:hypothetical protein
VGFVRIVPTPKHSASEEHHLSETPMVAINTPSHSLIELQGAVSREECSGHIQRVAIDSQSC